MLGKKVARFELFYQRFRGGGPIEIRVDGDKLRTIKTNNAKPEDAYEVVDVPDGEHLFSVRALGSEAHLYGVAMERSEPGVVYDSLGLVGARAERLLDAEPDHIRGQLAHRDADLLVLNFGGNEASNRWLQVQQYERDLTEVVRLMRSGKPAMSCLLFGPLDQAERNARGQIVTLATLAASRRGAAPRGRAREVRVLRRVHGDGWQRLDGGVAQDATQARNQRSSPRHARRLRRDRHDVLQGAAQGVRRVPRERRAFVIAAASSATAGSVAGAKPRADRRTARRRAVRSRPA